MYMLQLLNQRLCSRLGEVTAVGGIDLVKVCPLFLAETVAKTGMILLAGEVTSRANVDYQKIVRDTIKHIGYDDSTKGQ